MIVRLRVTFTTSYTLSCKLNKLIFISYYFPPRKGIGSLRNQHLFTHLKGHFEEALVISASNKKDGYVSKVSDSLVHYLPCSDYRTRSTKHQIRTSANHIRSKIGTSLASILFKVKESFPLNLLLDEGGLKYINTAKECVESEIRQTEKSQVLVYTSYRSFADLYIGYLIKKRNPNILWLADFRDPLINKYTRNYFSKYWQQYWYKKILSKVDLAITLSQGLKSQLSDIVKNVSVVYNGYYPPPLEELDKPKPFEKFTIAYTGSLYPYQDLSPLLDVLMEMKAKEELGSENFQFVYVGKDSKRITKEFQKYGLESFLNASEAVSLNDSKRIQQRSHLLLLLSWSSRETKGILTGKLFDYMGTTTPILGICNGPHDSELTEIFNKYSLGKMFYANDFRSDIKAYFKTTLSAKRALERPIPVALSWKNQADKLVSLIREQYNSFSSFP